MFIYKYLFFHYLISSYQIDKTKQRVLQHQIQCTWNYIKTMVVTTYYMFYRFKNRCIGITCKLIFKIALIFNISCVTIDYYLKLCKLTLFIDISPKRLFQSIQNTLTTFFFTLNFQLTSTNRKWHHDVILTSRHELWRQIIKIQNIVPFTNCIVEN